MEDRGLGDSHVQAGDESTSVGPTGSDLDEQMRAGYIAVREDREVLNRDWSLIDEEGWPD